MSSDTLLEVLNLKKYFLIKGGLFSKRLVVHAVDGVNFSIRRGESLGLVGESGSGKTTVARLLMRLIEPTEGIVRYMGHDIFEMNTDELRKTRLEMAMIFQDPFSSLDPRMTIKEIISEPLKIHGFSEESSILDRVKRVTELVNLPISYVHRYPRELSGGERQRVAIARALIGNPKLVVADEPTSALDVSVQAQILNLMKLHLKGLEFSLLYISHDLAVVRYLCNRLAVMYLGKLFEIGPTKDVCNEPMHPYTKALISAVPDPDLTVERKRVLLKGQAPSSINLPSGCRFSTRCPHCQTECTQDMPEFIEVKPEHFLACHLLK